MNVATRHFDVLDYARGIAILSVLLFHSLATDFGYDSLPWHGCWRDFSGQSQFLYFLPFSFGQAGVAVFFVVSGFCIHLSFETQGQRWRDFFIRRFFRIYPAYAAALIFCILLIDCHSGFYPAWGQWLTHLFLVHNATPYTFFGINGSFWSLAIEAQLYLLYPVLLFFVTRLGWPKAIMLVAGMELLIRTASAAGIPASTMLSNSPFAYWFSWGIGAYLADAVLKKQRLPFLKISPWWPLGIGIASYFVKPLYPFFFLLFALTTVCVLARILNRAHASPSIPSFPFRMLKRIGLISYSIYLLHEPLLNIYSYGFLGTVPQQSRTPEIVFLLLILLWGVVFVISTLWYHVFELPGIAFGKRLIKKSADGISVPVRYAVPLLMVVAASCLASAQWTPVSVEENDNLAWTLATDPDPSKRNGARAVELAEDACRRTHYGETIMVGTLAAAYAEDGRFNDAVSTCQIACQLAQAHGETNLLQINKKLLRQFQQHQPYRQ